LESTSYNPLKATINDYSIKETLLRRSGRVKNSIIPLHPQKKPAHKQFKQTVVATPTSINIFTDKLDLDAKKDAIPNMPCFQSPADFSVHIPCNKQAGKEYGQVKRFGSSHSIVKLANPMLKEREFQKFSPKILAKERPPTTEIVSNSIVTYGLATLDLKESSQNSNDLKAPQSVFFVGSTKLDRIDRRRAKSAKAIYRPLEPASFLQPSLASPDAAYIESVRGHCNSVNMKPYLSAFALMRIGQGTDMSKHQNIKFGSRSEVSSEQL
jgi:hypothetical protein